MFKKVLSIITLLLITSCSFNSNKKNSNNLSSFTISEGVNSSLFCEEGAPIEKVTSHDLFNLENKVEVKIEISDKQLKLLQEDHQKYKKSQIYRIVDKLTITLTIKGYKYDYEFEDVGIRQKGNMSRDNVYKDGKLTNPIHYKLSFDELFDDESIYKEDTKTYDEASKLAREKRDFLGLNKIDLKWNRNYDKTHVKEIYALDIYRSCGIVSQRSTLCNVKLNEGNNNYNLGIFNLTEPLDKEIIKNNFNNGNIINSPIFEKEKLGTHGIDGVKYGDLYKVTYGYGSGSGTPNMTYYNNSMIGVSKDDGYNCPVYERKTNKKLEYDDRQIKTFLDNLNKSDVDYKQLDSYIDLTYFAILEACNYLIGSPDDLRNNYNNYALYFRRVDGKAIIIPMDLDRCLGISKDYDPLGNASSKVDLYSKKTAQGNQVNKLYLKTLLSSQTNEYKNLYQNFALKLANSSWFTAKKFESYYNKAKANYDQEEIYKTNFNDRNYGVGFSLDEKFDNTNSNMSFNDYVKNKKEVLAKYQEVSDSNDNKVSSQVTSSKTSSSSQKENQSSLSKNSYSNETINLKMKIRIYKDFIEENKDLIKESAEIDYSKFQLRGNRNPLDWGSGKFLNEEANYLETSIDFENIQGNKEIQFKFIYKEKWFKIDDISHIYVNGQNNTNLIYDFSNSGNMIYIVDPLVTDLLIEFK